MMMMMMIIQINYFSQYPNYI